MGIDMAKHLYVKWANGKIQHSNSCWCKIKKDYFFGEKNDTHYFWKEE